MKKEILLLCCICFIFPFSTLASQFDRYQLISKVDTYYDMLSTTITMRTHTIWFQKVKIKLEDRLWSGILMNLQKRISGLDGESRLLFQVLQSKISQRNTMTASTTQDLVTQRELIYAVNDLRASLGLGILSYNNLLAAAAYQHANDLYLHFPYDTNDDGVKELIDHTGTDGTRVQDRVWKSGYLPVFVGENIAYNQTSIDEVMNDRKNSPTHYDNLITDKAKEIGVAKLGSYRVLVLGTKRVSD